LRRAKAPAAPFVAALVSLVAAPPNASGWVDSGADSPDEAPVVTAVENSGSVFVIRSLDCRSGLGSVGGFPPSLRAARARGSGQRMTGGMRVRRQTLPRSLVRSIMAAVTGDGAMAKSQKQDDEERLLLKRVATRDRQAFEVLFRTYHSQLSRYLVRLLRQPELAEEVINDTLFVVWEKAADFEGRSKVSTWITGIAYLKGIKALDKQKRMPEQLAVDTREVDELEESRSLIARLGLDNWIAEGLDRISPDQRSVVELTYYDGCSYQEIAEIMRCPVNTVKTRMFHARRRLAKLLPRLGEQTSDASAVDDQTPIGERAGVHDIPRDGGQ